jgi:hypothetical protein
MIFTDFCKRVASSEAIQQLDVKPVNEALEQRVNVLCEIMEPKMDILNRVEIPFIEEKFMDMDYVAKILSGYNQGDIPDYLLKTLSERLYKTEFTALNSDRQSIIKTLSVYICILDTQGSNKN